MTSKVMLPSQAAKGFEHSSQEWHRHLVGKGTVVDTVTPIQAGARIQKRSGRCMSGGRCFRAVRRQAIVVLRSWNWLASRACSHSGLRLWSRKEERHAERALTGLEWPWGANKLYLRDPGVPDDVVDAQE